MSDRPSIEFSESGESAKINYAVPLPGSHTGRRIVKLDLGLTRSAFKTQSIDFGRSLRDLLEIPELDTSAVVNTGFADRLLSIRRSRRSHSDTTSETRVLAVSLGDAQPNNDPGPEPYPILVTNNLAYIPTLTWSGAQTTTPVPIDPTPEPNFFIVEKYGISSFLGDYGMGRTVRTFTLLPGESTTIALKTWQSTESSRQESSSIIDSHEEGAKDRFAEKVQDETTDKSTQSKTEGWHAEAKVSAGWGWGSAEVSGGGSGEYSSGREEFSKQVGESVKEHASESSSKRELSVTSSSEQKEQSGSETNVERTIKNVNVRRVLNFVFRELNQEYTTKVHLKDVRIAFSTSPVVDSHKYCYSI